MIIITATVDFIFITQSSLNLSYWLSGIKTLCVAIFYIIIYFYRFPIYIGYIYRKKNHDFFRFLFFRFFSKKIMIFTIPDFGPQTKKFYWLTLSHSSGPQGVLRPEIFTCATDWPRLPSAHPNWVGGPKKYLIVKIKNRASNSAY